MLEGIKRPAHTKMQKEEFAGIVANLTRSVERFKKTATEPNQIYTESLAHNLKVNLPRLTQLYRNISESEQYFIYKQVLFQNAPELVIGSTIMIAFDNMVTAIQPLVNFQIADNEFKAVATQCRDTIDTYQ